MTSRERWISCGRSSALEPDRGLVGTVDSGTVNMTKTTRKDFLGLSAAVVTSAALGKTTSLNAMQVAPETGSAAGPTLIRGADLLTMDSTLGELQGK